MDFYRLPYTKHDFDSNSLEAHMWGNIQIKPSPVLDGLLFSSALYNLPLTPHATVVSLFLLQQLVPLQWSCPLKCFSQRVICFSVQGVILLTLFWIIQIAGFWKYTYYILLKAVGPSHPDFYLLPATVIGAKKHKSSIHKSGNIQIMSSLPADPPPPHYLIFFRCCRRSQTLSSAVTDVKFHPTYVIFSFSTSSLNSSKNVFLSSF